MNTDPLRQAVADYAQRVFDAAATEYLDRGFTPRAPVASGATKASGRVTDSVRESGRITGRIEFPTDQALFTDEGTRPHRIPASPVLSFYWPKIGRRVVVTSRGRGGMYATDPLERLSSKTWVDHPGYKGSGWFTDEATDAEWARYLAGQVDAVTVHAG